MPVNTSYQKALSLAKQGKLQEAQSLLSKQRDSQSQELLKRVNQAIARQKEERAANLPTVKPKDRRLPLLIGSLLVLGALTAWFYVGSYLPGVEQAKILHRRFALVDVCREVYFETYMERDISPEGFVQACYDESDFAVMGLEAEVDYCLAETQDGDLMQQFMQCLVDNGFQFSGLYIGDAK
jgi:hypothetical protein